MFNIIYVAICGENIALNTRKNLENELQQSIVTNSSALNTNIDEVRIDSK